MNKEATCLLNILKCFVWERKVEIEDDINWMQLEHLAEIHSVTGILGYMVISNPSETTSAIVPDMKRKCLSSVAIFARRAQQMKCLIQKMNQEKIEHLLFKGYVLRNYYPVPELRSFGDIDFLIPFDAREKSHQLMLKENFSVKTDWEPVYSYIKGTEYYEIHTEVMEVDVSDKADYRGYFSQVWNHAVKIGDYTWELTPEFHFLYLLTHIAKHISGSGAGIRMYMDIAVFIKHFGDSIDWNYIRKELEKLHFVDFANTVLTVVETYFEVASPILLREVSEQVLEDFMDFTMEGGTFGHAAHDAGVIALKKEERNTESVLKGAALVHRLFPSASSLEKRYTYLQHKHWLLPAAWIHRLVRTKDKWGQHTQEAKDILSADDEEVLKLKRIYKEIGL